MELLLVIGILAILSVAIVVLLNPLEYLKQARDSTRVADLNTLNKALSIYDVQVGGSMGTSSIVYISIADTSATCANLGLPTLPAGWTYSCVTTANLTKTDGTGWLPVNFSNLTIGSPIEKLPVDPVNTTTTGQYYTYVTGGSYELTAALESEAKHATAIGDGGSLPGVYEVGTDISLTPGTRDLGLVGWWKFDEGTGTTAYDSSPYRNNGTLYNSPTWTTSESCKDGGCLSFDGTDDYILSPDVNNIFDINKATIIGWMYKTTNPSGHHSISSRSSSSFIVNFYDNIFQSYFYTSNGTCHNPGTSYTSYLGSWHQFAVSYDGLNNKLYLDGILMRTVTDCGGNINASTNGVYVGARTSSSAFLGALFDDVRIYNRALTATEIQAIYNATN